MLLWALTSVSLILLAYEMRTLVAGVLWPLLQDPSVLQTDFHYYYEAAQRFSLDASRLYQASDDFIAGFAYPPLAILPFVVLSKTLPLGAALLVLTLASYAAVIGTIWLWWGYLQQHGVVIDARTAVAIGLIALALGPTYSNAIFGQVNALVLLSGVAFLAIGAGRPLLAGACLAAGVWLKIYPVLMVATGAWHRRAWAAIASTFAAGVLLAVIALPFIPLSAHRTFLTEVLPARIDKTAIHISNQSLVAVVERFHYPPSRFLHWTGEQTVTASVTGRVVGSVFGVVALLWLWRRAAANVAAGEAGLMALVAIVAPLGWGHTYILVVPLVMLRLATLQRERAVPAAVIVGCVAALMIPAGRVFGFADQWPHWLQNLFYSRYLLATVVLALLPLRQLPPLVEQVPA